MKEIIKKLLTQKVKDIFGIEIEMHGHKIAGNKPRSTLIHNFITRFYIVIVWPRKALHELINYSFLLSCK